jgi:hypothetical protein
MHFEPFYETEEWFVFKFRGRKIGLLCPSWFVLCSKMRVPILSLYLPSCRVYVMILAFLRNDADLLSTH